MKNEIWFLSMFLFLFSLIREGNCQVFHLPHEVEKIVASSCPICKKSKASFSDADMAYHNVILFLKQGSIDSCYFYLNTSTSTEITSYLKAKILYYKSLYNEALQIYQPLLDSSHLAKVIKENICTNIAEIYLEKSDFGKALQYFTTWDTAYKFLSNPNSIMTSYCNIGLCYLHTNKFEDAHRYFQKSVLIAKQLKDTFGLAILYQNIANQYYNQYLDNKALPYFLQGLLYARHSGNLEAQMNIYGSLAVVEENRKDFRSALNYMKQYVIINDSIFKRDNIYELAQNEKRLAIKEKDQQVQIVKQANVLQSLELNKRNLELSKQRQLIYLSSALAITFLFFFIFGFYAYRNKIQQNKTISAQRQELDELNNSKDQLFSIVAHDLRSPVQTLKVTLTNLSVALADNNIYQAQKVAGEIDNQANATFSLLNNLLYWALSQTGQLSFTKDKLNIKRIVDHVLYDYGPVASAKNMILENHVPEALFCIGDINTIKIILRNLIDNAIKFSGPSTSVIVSGRGENEECIISVIDSGKGIGANIVRMLNDKNARRVHNGEQTQEKSTGIGLWLSNKMAERNGGKLEIVSTIEGTSMNIYIPQFKSHEQNSHTYY